VKVGGAQGDDFTIGESQTFHNPDRFSLIQFEGGSDRLVRGTVLKVQEPRTWCVALSPHFLRKAPEFTHLPLDSRVADEGPLALVALHIASGLQLANGTANGDTADAIVLTQLPLRGDHSTGFQSSILDLTEKILFNAAIEGDLGWAISGDLA
jgi:hypothetical protein